MVKYQLPHETHFPGLNISNAVTFSLAQTSMGSVMLAWTYHQQRQQSLAKSSQYTLQPRVTCALSKPLSILHEWSPQDPTILSSHGQTFPVRGCATTRNKTRLVDRSSCRRSRVEPSAFRSTVQYSTTVLYCTSVSHRHHIPIDRNKQI